MRGPRFVEVELKIRVDDTTGVERELLAVGASKLHEEVQVDTYFQHPSRDFKRTDEALRVRRTPRGASIAYKGPRLSKRAKTRVELEIPVPDAEAAEELFRRLGFAEVAKVEKVRKVYAVGDVKIYVDSVKDLGDFVELEVIAPADSTQEAEERLISLARELGLPVKRSTLKSYLELLLEDREAG